MRLETLRLDSVSNETLNAGNRPAIPPGNRELLPMLLLIRDSSLGSSGSVKLYQV